AAAPSTRRPGTISTMWSSLRGWPRRSRTFERGFEGRALKWPQGRWRLRKRGLGRPPPLEFLLADGVCTDRLWPREESNLRTRIRSPLLYPLSYGARGLSVAPGLLCLGRRLDLALRRLALPQLAASFGLRVDLRSEQEREPGQPEPGQHDDDCRERAPCLVVGGEHGRVDGETSGRGEPDDHGKDGSRRDEPPARMLD